MIWNSIFSMTLIDFAVISLVLIAFWSFLRNMKMLKQLKLLNGVGFVLLGLFIIALFYLADLVTMHLFPSFMPLESAMKVMMSLHLNYKWIVTLLGVGSIVIGLIYLFRVLFPKLTSLHKNLENEIAAHKLIAKKLKELSFIDELTGIANRRSYDKGIVNEWNRAKRMKMPLSLIVLDIDYFKPFNDTYGHSVGDNCLRHVAQSLKTWVVRAGDLLARYGGEEFVVILPGSNKDAAVELAETLRKKVASLEIASENSEVSKCLTVSLGVASTIPGEAESPDALFAAADSALYRAKTEGRNCVRLSEFLHSSDCRESTNRNLALI